MCRTSKASAETSAHPIYVILGSGGHTAEMCKINQALLQPNNPQTPNKPVRYIVANSDDTSKRQMRAALPATMDSDFISVPRSRSVGQSWPSSVFTTLWALLWSCWLIWRDRPQLVLCNGPGTCVPYCYAAYMWRLLGRLPAHSKIVFVESYCRVETLSLSGRLLLPLVDMFVVHWPALATRYAHKPNLRYFGRLL
ncbi:UDP-N-acetylglucosamine transferase subunit ALG14 homolog [Drosophila novamexicana]|uniref:UDP-N-acetylglucosamine transferase subunit ALG14 homolog n=1 Tax=Drosophila novamexicana TaxID=47314 RepID=UPI0011E5D69A|nr:UDP-N-acetylglucosamine transferase subunit ALG14 homolog [Drosophila novamexicana]